MWFSDCVHIVGLKFVPVGASKLMIVYTATINLVTLAADKLKKRWL